MAKNICETLLDILAEVGVRQIFGMTGDALNPYLDAIRRDGRFEWIGVHHEETAAFPVVCYFIVDRSAYDRILRAGGYVAV